MTSKARMFTATMTIGLLGLVSTAALAGEGREVWDANCASCHGTDGKAKTKVGEMLKVRDLTDPAVRAKFDRERMIKSTKDGVPNKTGAGLSMPGFAGKLTDEQIASLIDHIEDMDEEGQAIE